MWSVGSRGRRNAFSEDFEDDQSVVIYQPKFSRRNSSLHRRKSSDYSARRHSKLRIAPSIGLNSHSKEYLLKRLMFFRFTKKTDDWKPLPKPIPISYRAKIEKLIDKTVKSQQKASQVFLCV